LYEKEEEQEKEDDKIQLSLQFVSQLPCTRYIREYFLWTARQYHSLCMFGWGL